MKRKNLLALLCAAVLMAASAACNAGSGDTAQLTSPGSAPVSDQAPVSREADSRPVETSAPAESASGAPAGSAESAAAVPDKGGMASAAASAPVESAVVSHAGSAGSAAAPDGSGPAYSDAEAAAYVTAAPVQDSYPVSSPSVEILLRNAGEKTYIYGKPFRLERQVGDGWETVPFREDTAFASIGILLLPGGENRQSYPLDCFAQPLTPGTYRLSMGMTDYTVGCTFRLE